MKTPPVGLSPSKPLRSAQATQETEQKKYPFGLSLSKPLPPTLQEPFDKLRANGRECICHGRV